jgi:hypothetical protein
MEIMNKKILAVILTIVVVAAIGGTIGYRSLVAPTVPNKTTPTVTPTPSPTTASMTTPSPTVITPTTSTSAPTATLNPTPTTTPFSPTLTSTYALNNTFLESGTYRFDVTFSYTGIAPQINSPNFNIPVFTFACGVTITEASGNTANVTDVVLQAMPSLTPSNNQLTTTLTIPVSSVVNNAMTFHITMIVNIPGIYNFGANIVSINPA